MHKTHHTPLIASMFDRPLPPRQLRVFEKRQVLGDVHVLIASVPWRRTSLNRLLREVAAQQLRPAFVHLVLDGDDVPNAPLDVSPLDWDGLKVTIKTQHPARGAGARWSVIDEIPNDHVVMNLDDDVGLDSDYVGLHYEALKRADAVCSGGYTTDRKFIMCDNNHGYEGPIACLQAGAFSARVSKLRGLRDMPMAAELLGVLGDDEALLSAHLWKTGVVVNRVNAPVRFDPLGDDPRSQYLSLPGRILGLRSRLTAETGWPWRL
jgi:hypothetical protein